ncbi:MAG TPA: GNAT family N-acetyltransferase [Polyangia bacterium]|nr:GNAT family N-acetyltransferase [Polyangia bacterium]
MLVRPAREEDLPGVCKLAAELVRQHHRLDADRFLIAEPLESGYHWFLSQELTRAGALILLAEDDAGALLGYAYATLEPRNWSDLLDACGKLNDIFVDEAARRRGVARALVEAVREELARRGAPRVVLMTAWRNPEAHAFFEAMGFRRTMLEMTAELPNS